MAHDMSLSQSLGGLRIANPDDQDSATSPTSPDPPSSALMSDSSLPGNSPSNTLSPSLPHQTPERESGLGFDPDTYSLQSNSNASPRVSQNSLSQPQAQHHLAHRSSMPLDYAGRQSLPQPSYSSFARPSMREPAPRPSSGAYGQQDTSFNPALSSQTSFGQGGDFVSSDTNASGITRSASRPTRKPLGQMPSRDSSRNYRQAGQHTNGGNGPVPARRTSQRARARSGAGNLDPPYSGTAPMQGSADDWHDRGAAVATRIEADASGHTVTRMVKKGVRDFNFGRTLGEGSYSTVIAATDRQTLKEYAIKVLDKRHIIKEKKVKYVNIERDTLNRLTEHPGVVRLYYTFQDERSLYFVLDLASQGELLGVLKKLGSFDVECTRCYGAEILDSIAYMHSRGVIHRDLKPENVLLDRDMHVKITDFGTAKILSQDVNANGNRGSGRGESPGDPTDGAESDRASSFVGTAEYVSPELLRDKNACKSSDLWAFGCIIYQLLAGRPPFKASNEYLTFQKILTLDYTFPDGFPDVARDLVERLLVLAPAKRLPVEHIKNHPFFQGVTWGKGLWTQKAPRLKPHVPPAAAPIKLNGSQNEATGYPSVAPSPHAGASSSQTLAPRPHLRGITELPPPSQLDIDWSPVLTENERILKLGNLIFYSSSQPHSPSSNKSREQATPNEKPKFSRFFSGNTTKKRERLVLITSNARLVIAAAGGNEKKAKMELHFSHPSASWRSYVDSKGLTCWILDTVCF